MAISPQYQFSICAGTNPASLVNVELLTAGGKYFYPPVLEDDFILRQPGASGLPFERGYQAFTWKSDLWRAHYDYLFTTILSNSLQGYVVLKTLRTMDDDTYTTWRGILTLPDMNQFQRNYKLYQNVLWQFTRCTLVTP